MRIKQRLILAAGIALVCGVPGLFMGLWRFLGPVLYFLNGPALLLAVLNIPPEQSPAEVTLMLLIQTAVWFAILSGFGLIKRMRSGAGQAPGGSLDRKMRLSYYVRIALIVVGQASLIAGIFYFNSSPPWVTNIFLASAVFLPFFGYFTAFYGIPAFASISRLHRLIVLTIVFGVATAVGFWVSMFVVFTLAMVLGGHRC